MDLTDWRTEIDEIDEQILSLLHERSKLAIKVGKLKEETGKISIYAPHREKQIIDRLKSINCDQFPEKQLEKIFAEIISACRSLEKKIRVAYLGPLGSHGHTASLEHFGSSVEFIPIVPQTDIFAEVESSRVDYGIVAIENSTYGTVRDVLEMFLHSPLHICSERLLPIRHHLLALSVPKDISKIYSHPQSFAQCRQWLHQNLPNIQQVEVASTSVAAEIASKEPKSAAIASSLASEIYKIPIVANSIMDNPNNITRFLVIGNQSAQKSGNDRTSILFGINDEVGALCQILSILESNQINMSKIDSFPSQHKPWEYVFFADLDVHVEDSNVQIALKEITAQCLFLKVLGAYPRGT